MDARRIERSVLRRTIRDSGRRVDSLCGARAVVIMWPATVTNCNGRGRPGSSDAAMGEHAMALEFAPGKTRIGWIGTGVMGSSMCGHLIAAGYQATVYNRTGREGQAAGREGGASSPTRPGRSPRPPTWSSRSSAIPQRRPRGDARAATARSPAPGRARVLVDMTTSEPALAVEIDRGGAGQGGPRGRRAGLRRRRRRPRGPALDHDRRRDGGRRRAPAALRDDGQDDRPPGAGRRRASTPRWSTRS